MEARSDVCPCAHPVRRVRVDVAVGELHVAARDAEAAAALPEELRSHSEGARKALPIAPGRWKKVPGNGRCSGVCAYVICRVRVDVAPSQGHVPADDAETAALPSEGRCSLSEGNRFRKFLGSASIGAMEESSGKWQVLGFAECSGFGACAHIVRLVRVDVAAGELHVAAQDVEAAALPEEWRSHSEGSKKVLPSGRWERRASRCSGLMACSGFVGMFSR